MRTEDPQSLENDMKPVDDISSLVSRFLQEINRASIKRASMAIPMTSILNAVSLEILRL